MKNFRGMVLVFFLAPKTGTGLSCTIYKIPVNVSLSLDKKPGNSNPNKWYKNGKTVIPRKVLLFSGKFPPGSTVPFEFYSEFPGFPYK